MLRHSHFAVALLAAAPLQAAPLSFGEIDGGQDYSDRTDLADCTAEGAGYRCTLTRNTFGDLRLDRGVMTLDARGRVRTLQLALDRRDFDRGHALLVGRYGKPTALQPRLEWRRFDDDGRITLTRGPQEALVTFDYPRNNATGAVLRREAVRGLLLFTLAGLAVGAALRLRRPRKPAQPVSMKQTLERRLSEGRDLSF
ncbi:hypothetical protein [Sphingomonas sp.]|jgi:hypothetical protein|uniref:hypothetical protein n=1 Tax=Sphingomonas sp. TaxID=28214 RepID=UPI002DE8B22B|nr:hypothetical protein [Sphingomonas sp.]